MPWTTPPGPRMRSARSAVRRPGRLRIRILVGLPDQRAEPRRALVAGHESDLRRPERRGQLELLYVAPRRGLERQPRRGPRCPAGVLGALLRPEPGHDRAGVDRLPVRDGGSGTM